MKNTIMIPDNPNINPKEAWTNLDDFMLLKGIFLHGYDNWKEILEDKSIWNDPPNPNLEPYKVVFGKLEKFDLNNPPQIEDENIIKYQVFYFE